jgi:hypothetical protein
MMSKYIDQALDAELQNDKLDPVILNDELRDEELDAVTGGNLRYEALKAGVNNLRA